MPKEVRARKPSRTDPIQRRLPLEQELKLLEEPGKLKTRTATKGTSATAGAGNRTVGPFAAAAAANGSPSSSALASTSTWGSKMTAKDGRFDVQALRPGRAGKDRQVKNAQRSEGGITSDNDDGDDDDDDDESSSAREALSAKLSRKIITQAEEQQREIAREERKLARGGRKNDNDDDDDDDDEDNDGMDDEDGDDDDDDGDDDDDDDNASMRGRGRSAPVKLVRSSKHASAGGNDDDDDEDDEEEEMPDDDEQYEDIEVSAEEEQSLNMFMPTSNAQRRTLADMIMEKIAEKEARDRSASNEQPRMDPKVIRVYTDVGQYLQHFTSGKIPKAFKIIPALANWEELVYLTAPDKWSSQAVYQATRLFTSNLKPKMVQRYLSDILLPRVRENIATYSTLNYHLYQSLRLALYKPSAFFKGILLPSAAEGCSARESVILASVLNKFSIPPMHAAAALLRLADIPYSGPCALFIKTLLNKKYNLPYRVIDRMVTYFANFVTDERKMPLIWHQTLLTFVQRFKLEFTPAQQALIRQLIRKQHHHLISADVKRELLAVAHLIAQNPDPQMRAAAAAAAANANANASKDVSMVVA